MPKRKACEDDYTELIDHLSALSNQPNKNKALVTASQNVTRVANLYKWYTKGKIWDGRNVEWLKKFDDIYKFIMTREQWKSDKSRCNQVCAIASILRRYKNDPIMGPVYAKYSTTTTKLSRQIYDELKDNTNTNKKYVSWDKVMKLKPVKLIDKLLFSLYTDIPPRRSEYKNLVLYCNYNKDSQLCDYVNYVVTTTEKGGCDMIILQDYKEAPRKKHGTITIKLPHNTSILFNLYIQDRQIKHNERLFTDYTFSVPVSRTFGMGVNGIRHSFASWFLDGSRSLREKEDMAKQMSTSLSTLQSSYFKLDLRNKSQCKTCVSCPYCIARRTKLLPRGKTMTARWDEDHAPLFRNDDISDSCCNSKTLLTNVDIDDMNEYERIQFASDIFNT